MHPLRTKSENIEAKKEPEGLWNEFALEMRKSMFREVS